MSTSSKQVPIRGLFIDGKEVPASQSDLLDVLNPATGAPEYFDAPNQPTE